MVLQLSHFENRRMYLILLFIVFKHDHNLIRGLWGSHVQLPALVFNCRDHWLAVAMRRGSSGLLARNQLLTAVWGAV